MHESRGMGTRAARPWLAWTAQAHRVKHPLHITCLLSLACLLGACAQLAATGGPQRQVPGLEAGSGFGLPSPASIKLAGYTDGDLLRLGKDYGASYPQNRVAAVGDAAHFTPDWHRWSGKDGLAYATYEFLPDGYAGEQTIRFTWQQTGSSFGDAWVGLSNFSKGRWDWFPMPEPQGQESMLAVDFAQYVQPGGDRMLVVALFTGIYAWDLAQVRLGVPPAPSGWAHTWGGADDLSGAVALTADASGNVYVAGYTSAFGQGGGDVLYLKFAPDGTLLWSKTWGGQKHEGAYAITLDSTGDVYLAGGSSSFSADQTYSAALLLKFDSAGNLLWQKTWEKAQESYAVLSVGLDNQGAVYMAGRLTRAKIYQGIPVSQYDAFVLKLSNDGTPQWQQAWAGDHSDDPGGGFTDLAGNTYLPGTYNMYDGGYQRVFLLKYDANGLLVWQKTWGGDSYCLGGQALLDGSGNVYLTGETGAFGQGDGDVFLLKYLPDGSLVWQKAWGTTGREGTYAIAMGSGGELYLAGEIYRTSSEGDLLLLELDSNAALVSARKWGGSGDNYAQCAFMGGALYLCGVAPLSTGVNFVDTTLTLTDNLAGTAYDLTEVSDALTGTWKDVLGTLADQTGTLDASTGQVSNALTVKVAPAP